VMKSTSGVVRISLVPAILGILGLIHGSVNAAVPVGLVASTATGQGGFGAIKGKLIWGGDQVPASEILVSKGTATKDPAICAATMNLVDHNLVVDPKTKGVKFAVAYLVKPKVENPEAVKELVTKFPKVEIDQKQCEFIPFVTALHQDQMVLFKSSDAANHNIHLSPFGQNQTNQMLAPGGNMTLKLVKDRPIPLACDIHPWMKGFVLVFDHPFFAVTAEDGSFVINGIPPGEFKFIIWQSKFGYATPNKSQGMTVKVQAGEATDLGEVKLNPHN